MENIILEINFLKLLKGLTVDQIQGKRDLVSGNKVQNTREKSKEIMKKRLKIKNLRSLTYVQ